MWEESAKSVDCQVLSNSNAITTKKQRQQPYLISKIGGIQMFFLMCICIWQSFIQIKFLSLRFRSEFNTFWACIGIWSIICVHDHRYINTIPLNIFIYLKREFLTTNDDDFILSFILASPVSHCPTLPCTNNYISIQSCMAVNSQIQSGKIIKTAPKIINNNIRTCMKRKIKIRKSEPQSKRMRLRSCWKKYREENEKSSNKYIQSSTYARLHSKLRSTLERFGPKKRKRIYYWILRSGLPISINKATLIIFQ